MSLVAERLLLLWASARSAGATFSLLTGVDLEHFKPKCSLIGHSVRQEIGFSLSACSVLNDKKIEMFGQNVCGPKSIVVLFPLGCQEHIKTESLHCFFPLIKRYSTDTNGYTESMFLPHIFHIHQTSYAPICFYFADCKLLCQRLVTQGNVLGRDTKRNQ